MGRALITVWVMPTGNVNVAPGHGFGGEHCDLLVEVAGAVNDVVRLIGIPDGG